MEEWSREVMMEERDIGTGFPNTPIFQHSTIPSLQSLLKRSL
jgi:hypothetical protein